MDSYGAHLFTEAVQAEQAKAGMRGRYAAIYERRHRGPLDAAARTFIDSRTSFYMASVSASGWPYLQHRGGPPGFLKVIGEERIGFADYTGNKQFITKGNLATETRVALFLMDYPQQARLKLLGRARMIEAGEDPDLAACLAVEGAGPVERLATVEVTALDWNCPKYITPRYSEPEIAQIMGPEIDRLHSRIAELEAELARLRQKGETA